MFTLENILVIISSCLFTFNNCQNIFTRLHDEIVQYMTKLCNTWCNCAINRSNRPFAYQRWQYEFLWPRMARGQKDTFEESASFCPYCSVYDCDSLHFALQWSPRTRVGTSDTLRVFFCEWSAGSKSKNRTVFVLSCFIKCAKLSQGFGDHTGKIGKNLVFRLHRKQVFQIFNSSQMFFFKNI